MLKSFCDEFAVDKEKLKQLGALDIILDFDTKYFIDPALLRKASVPEFLESSSKVERYFAGIVALVKTSAVENDMYWKRADKLLTFKEIKATCLGYSNKSTSGNAIGKELRKSILRTIKDLLINGTVEPIIFELLGVFQEKIGCDRISDLVTFVIRNEIVAYTRRIMETVGTMEVNENGLVVNPYNGEEVLLLPMEILSPLPIADSYDDIDFSCAENERVRNDINQYFDLGSRKKLNKEEINSLLMNNVDFREQIVEAYKSRVPDEYDFEIDSAGQIIWYEKSRQAVAQYPLCLKNPQTEEELFSVIVAICEQFKCLIENNGWWRLLYDDKDSPKHESAAQLLFFGIADAYCGANDISISREVNNGHGPVDFKFSVGYQKRILVEIKLTSNNQLIHGMEKQLPTYMKQENTKKAIYLIIENGHHKRLERFQDFYNKLDGSIKEKIPYILIDGNIQASASRA